VIDGATDTVPVTAIYAGIDPFNMSQEELDMVADLLREQRPLLRFYTDDMTSVAQALASGELVAAMTWDDTAASLKAEGVPVEFMKPKEGVLTWVCGMALLKDVPHLDKAYDLIDAMIDPSAGEYLITEYGYGHSNAKSFELVSDERLAELGLPKDPTELLYSGVFFRLFKEHEKTITMFEEVKAGF
jgi:spermidine/putrescine transport system substrate-binding protein